MSAASSGLEKTGATSAWSNGTELNKNWVPRPSSLHCARHRRRLLKLQIQQKRPQRQRTRRRAIARHHAVWDGTRRSRVKTLDIPGESKPFLSADLCSSRSSEILRTNPGLLKKPRARSSARQKMNALPGASELGRRSARTRGPRRSPRSRPNEAWSGGRLAGPLEPPSIPLARNDSQGATFL